MIQESIMKEGSFDEGGALNTFGEIFNFEGKEFNSKKVHSLMGDLSVKSVLQETIKFYKTYV